MSESNQIIQLQKQIDALHLQLTQASQVKQRAVDELGLVQKQHQHESEMLKQMLESNKAFMDQQQNSMHNQTKQF